MNEKIGVFGRSAFKYILEKERPKEIWLPDYICESLVEQADILNIPIKWYHINNDFSIDWSTVKNPKCILIIRYFGYIHNNETENINTKNIVICDETHLPLVQRLKISSSYKYSFRSLRKYYKLEDGVMLNETINMTKYSRDIFSKLFDSIRLELEAIRRKGIYLLLSKTIPNKLNFYSTPSFMYPLLLKRRDYIRGKLIENGFNCPIHWRESRQKYLAEHELSIPLTYSVEDLDKIIKIIKRYV